MTILFSIAALLAVAVGVGGLHASVRRRREPPLPPTRHLRRMTIKDTFL